MLGAEEVVAPLRDNDVAFDLSMVNSVDYCWHENENEHLSCSPNQIPCHNRDI